ncbi:MAG: phosphoenolpyruvate carboxylase [Nitrospirota bacterium]|nr:phosphoenolpyruvate carboxylase [Nitrospirota bacterium]
MSELGAMSSLQVRSMRAPEHVRSEVNLLGRALGKAIRDVSGEELYALEEEVRLLSKRIAAKTDAARLRGRLRKLTEGLSHNALHGLVRCFSSYFHLVNIAEERHRVRVNRLLNAQASQENPPQESVAALIKAVKDMGLSKDEARALLSNLRLCLTFTAHPTESRRFSLRRQIESIAKILERMDRGQDGQELLEARVALLWSTRELHDHPPSVRDEVRGGLYYLPTSLWEALPKLLEELTKAFALYYQEEPDLPLPLSFYSWIGGDRDGNPFVTAEVTDWAQHYATDLIKENYERALQKLTLDLSVYQGYIAQANPTLKPNQGPYPPEELFRNALEELRQKLGQGKLQANELAGGLRDIAGLLDASGLKGVATTLVKPLLTRIEAFGLELAHLDLREEASRHTRAVDELFKVAGVYQGYVNLTPNQRQQLLLEELKTRRPLMPRGYEPKTIELQTALGALESWRAKGAYIISMTHHVSDVLEVFLLARETGLYTPSGPLPFNVTPLFETLEDLFGSPRFIHRLLSVPLFLAHVQARGGMEVMIGYSDSNKEGGYLPANWALYRAQQGIVRAAKRFGVGVSFFHGRGTSTARGGSPAGKAIAALPRGTIGTRMRITEQGEALTDRYFYSDLAYRNLEQLLFHFGLAAGRERLRSKETPKPWMLTMKKAALSAAKAYRALVTAPQFLVFFRELTPIAEIAELKIASRPASRNLGDNALQGLRAIPWVMAWSQVRLNLPGWYGMGSGLGGLDLALLREMYQGWPFFGSLIDTAAMSLAKAELGITKEYLRLVSKPLQQAFFPKIEAEFLNTKALLESIFEGPILQNDPTLKTLIGLRNPYLEPLHHIQVELLKRTRGLTSEYPEWPRLREALLSTLLGIAAGLKNTG